MDTFQFITPVSHYALTTKQTATNDFRKKNRYTKINLNDQAIFRKFLQIFFVLETKLEMI